MEININRGEQTLEVIGDIPMKVLLSFLESEWGKIEYEGLDFPFKTLDFKTYKVVEPWVLVGDTFNYIHNAGISTE